MDYAFSKTKKFISNNKLLFNVLKTFFFLVSSYYLILIFSKNYNQIKELSLFNKGSIFLFVLISSIVYMFLLVILALGWKKIIELLEGRHIKYWLVTVYLRSLIYKYLPGNIFHYANRQMAANQAGIKHSTLLKSNLYEAAFLIIAAVIFSSVYIEKWLQIQIDYSFYLILFIFSISVIFLYVYRKTKFSQITSQSMPYYLLYFLGIGLICYYAINIMTENSMPFLQCVYLYSIAWIAGFIIPGAPGGIGVRESVFILLSNNIIIQSDAIFVVALLRISTTLGEVFAYLIAQFNRRTHLNDTLN